MFDKYFDELQIGTEWSSRARTLTEADIVMFAALSGDWFPLHTDREWAAKTPFGQRIAHGFLVLSMSTGLLNLTPGPVVAFYGIERVRFVKPTFIGDTIHVEAKVLSKEEKGPGTGVVVYQVVIMDVGGDTKVTSVMKLLLNVQPKVRGMQHGS